MFCKALIKRSNICWGDIYKWISYNRKKTDILNIEPLLPPAITINNKYSIQNHENGKLLPIISNQKMNAFFRKFETFAQ
ncbi:MAG: hypothetical protein BGO31_00290 [Bacteroidetes bacterium 43-16]|nr:MAG: hypothetical protein BGO31_00290 [Bacteroidetes bacterium 43-16]